MSVTKRILNVIRYGVGPGAKERKNKRKHKIRLQKFESGEWQRDQSQVNRRYQSYEDYLTHQASKFDKVEHRLKEMEKIDFAEFERRFKQCDQLNGCRSVLCLGARLGTEVKALHSLGYFAVGIDLNPGKSNDFVLHGDFHALVFPDESVDAVYSNAMDHLFDLRRVVSEVFRVLKVGGIFIVELPPGYEEGFIPGEYASRAWSTVDAFSKEIASESGLEIEQKRDLGEHRRDQWYQVVLRKPSNKNVGT